jgi:hypothetical protein
MQQYRLAERAVLMRCSFGLPGKNRKDRNLTENVKSEHGLGKRAGSWIKQKYPDWALEPLEKLVTEARAYHAAVTLPFDAGIGILPAALIMEYGDKMRQFKYRFEALRDNHFRAKYSEMVEWAKAEHNGTFDASDYPDVNEVCESFYFATEPLPVPDAAHFEGTMSSLLGVDAEGVNIRVADAMVEAQKELMRRLVEPVRAMAAKLSEAPKEGKESPIFRDTLVGNIKEIAGLAPKLNIGGDPAIDAFCKEIEALTVYEPDTLRKSEATRGQLAAKADDIAKRMEAYKL